MPSGFDSWGLWLLSASLFFGSLALGSWVRSMLEKWMDRINPDRPFIWVGRAVFMLFAATGAVVGLNTLGLDVSALVAGLGVTGLSIGLASKDIVTHCVAGVFLLLYRPFRIGDTLGVKGYRGVVRDMNFRHAVLEDEEGRTIYVPNAMLLSEPIRVSRGEDE